MFAFPFQVVERQGKYLARTLNELGRQGHNSSEHIALIRELVETVDRFSVQVAERQGKYLARTLNALGRQGHKSLDCVAVDQILL